MASGTVKWFDSKKGYGFIKPDDGSKDVFVHITALQAASISSLAESQRVTYELASNKGKTFAEKLQIVNG